MPIFDAPANDPAKHGSQAWSAREFLSAPNAVLGFWCGALGIDPGVIVSAYQGWQGEVSREKKHDGDSTERCIRVSAASIES